jgi:hypothetical protein
VWFTQAACAKEFLLAGGTDVIWDRNPHPGVFVTSISVAHENLPSIEGNLAIGIGITYLLRSKEGPGETNSHLVEPPLYLCFLSDLFSIGGRALWVDIMHFCIGVRRSVRHVIIGD